MTKTVLIDTHEARLDTATLREVAQRLGPTPTLISPLCPASPLLTRSPSGERAAAVDTGAAAFMLSVAHSATVVVQLELVLEEKVLTHLVCFDSNSDRSVCLTPTPDGVILREPAPVDWLVGGVASYMGSSVMRAVPFLAEVDLRVAWPLVIAVDLQRRHTLLELAHATELGAERFDAPKLLAAAENAAQGWQSLSSVLTAATGSRPDPNPATMQWGLDEAARRGWIEAGAEGYALTGDALAFARRFLLVDSMLRLQVASEPRGAAPEKALLWFVQAGVHDVLSIEGTAGGVTLETLSAAAVLELVHRLLEDPAAATSGPRAPQAKHGTQLMPAFS